MPGRSLTGTTQYRYGFNGQEKSTELNENLYQAQFWEYDSRTSRRWNLDPVLKPWESGYSVFHNSPLFYNDPNGDDPPKKPSFLTRLWRAVGVDQYKNRAETYANENGIDESKILDVGNDTWVVVNDKNPNDVRYSVFRKSKMVKNIKDEVWLATSPKNDDLNLTAEQFSNTQILGSNVIMIDIMGGAGNGAEGVFMLGNRLSKPAVLGYFEKAASALQNYKKLIRFCVGDPDLLNKGYHLHFDQVAKDLELGLRPAENGGIAIIQVGKLSVGTAQDIKNAIAIFNKAMMNVGFREELLVRLKTTQEYLQNYSKTAANAQLAIDKAHEINYLIKAVLKIP